MGRVEGPGATEVRALVFSITLLKGRRAGCQVEESILGCLDKITLFHR